MTPISSNLVIAFFFPPDDDFFLVATGVLAAFLTAGALALAADDFADLRFVFPMVRLVGWLAFVTVVLFRSFVKV